MKTKTFFSMLLAGAIAATALVSAANAQNPRKINALVMLEDEDTNSTSRNVPIYKQVLSTIQEALNTRNIQVYDENITGMDFQRPNKNRRTDAELISMARAISQRTPIDVVVLFQMVMSIERNAYNRNIIYPQIRMPGRVLNVNTGQIYATFEVDVKNLEPLPNPCDLQNCLPREVGRHAKRIGADLAAALISKLENFSAGTLGGNTTGSASTADLKAGPATPTANKRCTSLPRDVNINVTNFSGSEILEIQKTIANFACYHGIRPLKSGATYATWSYNSSAELAVLDRNLRIMLTFLNLKGQVRFDGRGFDIDKVQTRRN